MLIWKVEELLRERGIPVTRERTAADWLKIDIPDMAMITVEPRPHYCDRGNFIVKVFPQGNLALEFDHSDGFPRYYFGVLACADEIEAWMRVRHLLGSAVERS